MKKLMIVDDEELMRQKLETLVDYSLLGLQLVAQARDGSEGERLILTHQPDVVLTEVEQAQTALGELTGRTAREDMVARIFERFCVGK